MNHTEKLINDLKLTYQLDSGSMPFNPQSVKLVRYMKELVIDIVNDPLLRIGILLLKVMLKTWRFVLMRIYSAEL